MSHNISSSDIHILPVDGDEDKYFKSVIFEKDEDGLTKMSWITEIKATDQRFSNEDKISVAQKMLLIGKFYSPCFLRVYFSRSKTGYFKYYADVAICPAKEHLLEDKNIQEPISSRQKEGGVLIVGGKPLCDIWISVNQKEKIPFTRLLGREVWLPNQTYTFNFQLWFKLIDQSAPISEKNALKQFSILFGNQTLCDINFCLENSQHVGGHKYILAARSPVFAAMFQHEMQESKTGHVVIPDIELDIFKEMLYFIYSGQIETPLTERKAKLLFLAADKYDIEDLKNICLHFLSAYILYKTNVIHLLVWAHTYVVDKLKEAALEMVAINFDQICLTEEWVNFTRDYPDLSVLATREMVKKRKHGDVDKWMGYSGKTSVEKLFHPVILIYFHFNSDRDDMKRTENELQII